MRPKRGARFAHPRIDLFKRAYRHGLAEWADTMLSLEELASVLRRMGQVDALIGDVQAPLRRLARYPGEHPTAEDPKEASRSWFGLLGAAVSLREELTRAGLAAGTSTISEIVGRLAVWRGLRTWALEPDRDLMACRTDAADAVLASGSTVDATRDRVWEQRSRDLLRTPFDRAATTKLRGYWDEVDAYERLEQRRRWLRARPAFPRAPSGRHG